MLKYSVICIAVITCLASTVVGAEIIEATAETTVVKDVCADNNQIKIQSWQERNYQPQPSYEVSNSIAYGNPGRPNCYKLVDGVCQVAPVVFFNATERDFRMIKHGDFRNAVPTDNCPLK